MKFQFLRTHPPYTRAKIFILLSASNSFIVDQLRIKRQALTLRCIQYDEAVLYRNISSNMKQSSGIARIVEFH